MHGADAEDFSGGAGQRGIYALLLKKPHGLLAAQKRASEVHIHHPLPLLEGEILKRGNELDARVVHEDVETTKLIHSTLKHAAHRTSSATSSDLSGWPKKLTTIFAPACPNAMAMARPMRL